MMEHKYKVGDWVKIINVRPMEGNEEFKKYIGEVFPITKINNGDYNDEMYTLPIDGKHIFYDYSDGTGWGKDELRLATPQEIEKAKLKWCAETI